MDRWCSQWSRPRGGVLSLDQQWRMAQAWYSADRRDPQWRRRTTEEINTLFGELGLTGDFWRV